MEIVMASSPSRSSRFRPKNMRSRWNDAARRCPLGFMNRSQGPCMWPKIVIDRVCIYFSSCPNDRTGLWLLDSHFSIPPSFNISVHFFISEIGVFSFNFFFPVSYHFYFCIFRSLSVRVCYIIGPYTGAYGDATGGMHSSFNYAQIRESGLTRHQVQTFFVRLIMMQRKIWRNAICPVDF